MKNETQSNYLETSPYKSDHLITRIFKSNNVHLTVVLTQESQLSSAHDQRIFEDNDLWLNY